MYKGESIMKPNKEQKGKNNVLVIAIGKHPKVGPGERKPKSLKKADEPRKSKSQSRRERKAVREARREESGETSESIKEKGSNQTAALQMKQQFDKNPHLFHTTLHSNRISWKHLAASMGKSKEELLAGDYDADELQAAMNDAKQQSEDHKSRVEEKRAPKSMEDLQGKFRTGLAPHREVTHRSKKEADMDSTLHRLTQQLKNMGVDMSGINLKDHLEGDEFKSLREKIPIEEAFKAMGKKGAEERSFNRTAAVERKKNRGVGFKTKLDEKQGITPDHPSYGKYVGLDELDAAQAGDESDGSKEQTRLNRVMMGRSHQGQEPQTLEDWAREHGRFEHAPSEAGSPFHHDPSETFTTPFATTHGTGIKEGAKKNPEFHGSIEGEHGSSLRGTGDVEGTMHGFAPLPAPGLARVGDQPGQDDADEEANYDDVQDRMADLQRGSPMDLAFRLLKNDMCKGSDCDGCDKCKCKGSDKCKCSKCC
tara:strand:- start:634 stop:2073 length:1440 start_codon:yes stop_codon:yes gene_type:complete